MKQIQRNVFIINAVRKRATSYILVNRKTWPWSHKDPCDFPLCIPSHAQPELQGSHHRELETDGETPKEHRPTRGLQCS